DRAAGADFRAEALGEKGNQRVRFGTLRFVLDARIHVFDVLAENDDVELLRLAHGARHAFEVADGADAGVEVQQLSQRDVERSNPPADRGREGTFDGDAMPANDRER